MCSIIGALVASHTNPDRKAANHILNVIIERSHERGRDGRGFSTILRNGTELDQWFWKETTQYDGWTPLHILDVDSVETDLALIGNLRAEPTTEFVRDKTEHDQQPYRVGKWSVVHNGTIANDKELRTGQLETTIDSAAIVEALDSTMLVGGNWDLQALGQHFLNTVQKLRGSYAILATHDDFPEVVFAACNYRPIWFAQEDRYGVFFASARHYFPDDMVPQMVEPYSVHMFCNLGTVTRLDVSVPPLRPRSLVVCSGGLDSVVAATWAKKQGHEVELLHFQYGSRAEGPEVVAVSEVAEALGVNVRYFPLPIYKPGDSPLLQADSKIAGGEAGAEFAHEWVPARNLAMLAVATALAEAGGYDYLVLGNNLEEAGAYPDNEPEFIAKFNDLLPFAVGDGKKLKVLMPVGNLMKHEIVKLGHDINAPLDKTWSCYRSGHEHCGTCGPCYMRRTAFEINQLPEVISYSNEKA